MYQTSQGTILHARSCQHMWEGTQPLSVKAFFGGRARYFVAGGTALVDDHGFFVVNANQPYRIEITAHAPVESLCIFFAPGVAEYAAHSLSANATTQLDDPFRADAAINFYERTYAYAEVTMPALMRIRAAFTCEGPSALWLEEQIQMALGDLMQAQEMARSQVDAVPLARPAVRDEIYRRLVLARDYIAAEYDQPLSLAQIAAIACLSPNHLLRTFRATFHTTPHGYLTQRRIAEACRLLTMTDQPITWIALAVGYTSPNAFATVFHRAQGCTPKAYRQSFGK
jgi:AraC family transcriptional regulator